MEFRNQAVAEISVGVVQMGLYQDQSLPVAVKVEISVLLMEVQILAVVEVVQMDQ
jgi:hypothetical protein